MHTYSSTRESWLIKFEKPTIVSAEFDGFDGSYQTLQPACKYPIEIFAVRAETAGTENDFTVFYFLSHLNTLTGSNNSDVADDRVIYQLICEGTMNFPVLLPVTSTQVVRIYLGRLKPRHIRLLREKSITSKADK